MGLDRRRRLVVGDQLRLLPLARRAGRTATVSATAAALLVVPDSMSSARAYSHTDAAQDRHTAPDADTAAPESNAPESDRDSLENSDHNADSGAKHANADSHAAADNASRA